MENVHFDFAGAASNSASSDEHMETNPCNRSSEGASNTPSNSVAASTVTGSRVASESAFSAGERVLDDKRSRLTADILDCLLCLKDWEDARLGIHPCAAKDEFREYFADSDIDD